MANRSSRRIMLSVSGRVWPMWWLFAFAAFLFVVISLAFGRLGSDVPNVIFAVCIPIFLAAHLARLYIDSLALILDEQGLTWRGKRFEIEAKWSSIGFVHVSFENRSGRNITFFDREGKKLFTVPLYFCPYEKVLEMLALIAVRLPEGVEIEQKVETTQTRIICSLLAYPCLATLLLPFNVGADATALFTAFLCAFPAAFGLRLLASAIFGYRLELPGAKICPEYRDSLYPYMRWHLVGAPLPGARAFQYREISSATVRKALWKHKSFMMVMALLIPVAFVAGVLAGFDWLGLLVLFIVPEFIAFALIFNRQVKTDRIKSLGAHLNSEIVLDEDGVSLWHDGAFVKASVSEWPEIKRSEDPLASSLSLRVGGKSIDFDSAAMQLIESTR